MAATMMVFAAVSCTGEIEERVNPGVVFTGELNVPPVPRTSVGAGGVVSWTDSETIGVWDGTDYVQATDIVVSGNKITFKAAVDAGSSRFIAIYPYEAGLVGGSFAGLTDGKVTINPVFTSQEQGSVNVGIAQVNDISDVFSFCNVTNVVRFQTSRKDIGFVRFSGAGGETLYAQMLVDPSTGEAALTASGSGSQLTADLAGAGSYCLAIGQGVSLPDGFKMEFFTDNTLGNYLGKVEGTKPMSFLSQNTSINLGDIDSKIVPLFSYVWWKPEGGDASTVGNNLGLDKSKYPVNMFERTNYDAAQPYVVAESDIPGGSTVTYVLNKGLSAVKSYGGGGGSINASNGRFVQNGSNSLPNYVSSYYVTVSVTKDGLTAVKNFPVFVRCKYDADGDHYSIQYNPFVLFANGKKENSLPAPTIMQNGSVVSEFSLSIHGNMYYTNIDGPAEHVCTHKLQNVAPYNTEYIARVMDIYSAKLPKNSNYGTVWPWFTYYLAGTPEKTIDEHHALSPLYIDTDNSVHVKAEGEIENFWKDAYGYPNGFLEFSVVYKTESGVNPWGGTQTPKPFVVYFNEDLDY